MLEEVAVVADKEHRAGPLREELLEPEDAFDVEMVGRLVHEEHVGLGGEGPRDGQAFRPAAGQGVDGGVPVGETAPAEGEGDAAGPVAFVHSRQGGGDDRFHREARLEDGILGDVADSYAAPDGARAAVGRGKAGEDLEEGGLARAVRSHEADLVPFEEPERELFEESPGPVGLADRVAAQEKRGGHPTLLFLLRLLFSFFMPMPLATVLTSLRRVARPSGGASARVGLGQL